MIHFTYGNKLDDQPSLAHSMFRDRARQFFDRLNWAVSVSEKGEERDEYDSLNPLYIIVAGSTGLHAGSMRFLPTTGRTMVNEHFLHVTDGVRIESPLIWECTRFCLGKGADRRTAACLLAAGGRLMRACGVEHFVGVFDPRMERIYRLIGAAPTVIGRKSTNHEGGLGVGLWSFDDEIYTRLLTKAGMSPDEMDHYFDLANGAGNRFALSA